MKNVVIAGYARSPFTLATKGELTKVRADELMAQVIKGLLAKTAIDPNDIEDLIVGCAFPEGGPGYRTQSPAPPSTASAARRCMQSTWPPAPSR